MNSLDMLKELSGELLRLGVGLGFGLNRSVSMLMS
jgi:hypothetical protein